MRKFFLSRIFALTVAAGTGITLQSCQDSNVTNNTSSPARLEGQIIERVSATPIEKVLVKVLPFNRSVETDVTGKFALSIELADSNATTVTVIFSKTGFISDTLRALKVQNGHTTAIPEVRMFKLGNNGPTGDATHIVLIRVSTANIFVAGSGGQATADLIFEVRDANGKPVDLQHKAVLNFRITGNPGNSASIFPASIETDENGRAITTVTSGTVAGALQVVAEIQGKAIASAPVPIAVHGGLPDRNHFSLGIEKLNIAGLLYLGLQDRITAYVGDKYSNPVPPGTIVQFQSTGGIVEGSAVTNALGQATVILTSASPVPPLTNSDGLVAVIAETVDETRTKIKVTTKVLFSGPTQISVTPTTFTLQPFGTQTFSYMVSDLNFNPLVAGSQYTVSTDNGKVSGATNVTMRDTQSKAATMFSFVLNNSQPDSIAAKDANVEIKVASPNGDVIRTITGKMLPLPK
jgi:hypothetical protein